MTIHIENPVLFTMVLIALLGFAAGWIWRGSYGK